MGSEGIGLPSQMSDKTIETIKATACVVAPKALDITRNFYERVFTKMPELFSFFNKTNKATDVQPQALAGAIVAYASNIDALGPLVVPHGPVEVICHKHAALNIQPAHYPVVHDNLMESVGEVLGDVVTPEIAGAWTESVLFLAKVMIHQEEGLYAAAEKRAGGWRGMKEVKIVNIEDMTADVKRFSFQDPSYTGNYDVSPGQFLTLQVDPNGDGLTAPRHYTCVSSSGDPFLQCCVKKALGRVCPASGVSVPGGVVSTYLHEKAKVGDTVKLSPPFGVFTPREADESAVLISAGIGVTPMYSFSKHFGDQTALIAHIDKNAASHPSKDHFASLKCPKMFKYTEDGGRPKAADFAADIVKQVGTSHGFYLCGPQQWMSEMRAVLTAAGATSVHYEVFGPEASGCPMKAGA